MTAEPGSPEFDLEVRALVGNVQPESLVPGEARPTYADSGPNLSAQLSKLAISETSEL